MKADDEEDQEEEIDEGISEEEAPRPVKSRNKYSIKDEVRGLFQDLDELEKDIDNYQESPTNDDETV